jgi:hypothetical protein
VVNGETVEEGEGLGPRKELFALMSQQLQAKWIKVRRNGTMMMMMMMMTIMMMMRLKLRRGEDEGG